MRLAPVHNIMKTVAIAVFALAATACTVSPDQEVAIGQQNADAVNAQLPIVTEPEIANYIQAFGDSIAQKTSRSDLSWHFYVVNIKQVNAFALPGGFIYVNRGLIESSEHLDELAGTLGHEIGHVIQRHAVKQMENTQKANVGLAVVCTLTSICQSGLGQVAVNVGGSAIIARHSRLDELQADSESVVNVTRAGIDPQGIPDLFQLLVNERKREPTQVEGWFASHPLEEKRIARAKSLIAALHVDGSSLLRDNEGYHAFKERVGALPPPPAARELLRSPAAGDSITR